MTGITRVKGRRVGDDGEWIVDMEYVIDGQVVSEAEYKKAFPDKPLTAPPGGHLPACWPMLSDAMGVHPSQIEQARARNRRRGVNVDYAPDGRAILADRGQRRDLMRVEGFHDNNGGYGDG